MTRNKRASDIAALLKPYIIQWVNEVGTAGVQTISPVTASTPTGDYAPTPHALTSAHHSGKLPHSLTWMSGFDDDTHTIYASADGDGTRSAYQAERLNQSITASAGLAGGGLLTACRVISISYGSSSLESVYQGATASAGTGSYPAHSDHRHAVSATASPGIAACLLATNSSGELNITGDFMVDAEALPTLFADVSENAIYINPLSKPPTYRGAVTITPANATQRGQVIQAYTAQSVPLWQVLDATGNDLIVLTNEGDLESGCPNFVSGLTGWQITHEGNAEFWNAYIRGELHASVFVADEMHATGGTLAVLTTTKVASPISAEDNKMLSTTASFMLVGQASWDTALSYVSGCDVLRGKFMSAPTSGSALDLYDVYLEVIGSPSSNNDRDLSNGKPGTFDIPVIRRSGGAASVMIPTGTALVKWGEVSQAAGTYTGGIIITSDLNQSPYMDIFTIDSDSSPWAAATIKPRTRIGNLDGVLGLSEQWGIATGKNLSDNTCPYVVVSDLQVGLFGVKQSWWDSGGNIVGQVNPNANSTSALFWFGPSENDKKLEFRSNGELIIRGNSIVGPNTGFVADFVEVYCPFDGPTPYETNYQVNINSKLGQTPTKTGGIIGASGRFGKAIMIAASTTNLVDNPDMINACKWNFSTDGTASAGGTIAATTSFAVTGSTALRVTSASAGTQTVAETDHIFVGAGASVHLQGWQYARSSASTNIRLRDVTNSANRITLNSSTILQWEFLSGSWFNDTGAAASVKVMLTNTASTVNISTYFDAVQFEREPDMTPFAHGSMASGYSWSGSAHKSNTIREAGVLSYSGSYFGTWENATLSGWVKLPTQYSSSARTVVSRRIDASNRILFSVTTDGKLSAIVREGGVNDISVTSSCVVADGDWHHVVATFQSILSGSPTAILYVDGASDASALGSSSGLDLRAGDIYIGNLNGAYFLNGYLDDLLVADRKYTSDEINAIYESSVPVAVHTNNFETMWTGFNAGQITAHAGGLYGETSDGTKSFALSNQSAGLSWGGFTVAEGDVVLGDNKADSAAIFWDKSTGSFGFYGSGSATPNVTIGTQGQLTFGSGSIILSSSGMQIRDTSSSNQSRIKWEYKPTVAASIASIGYVTGDFTGAGQATLSLLSSRVTGNPWSSFSTRIAAEDSVSGQITAIRLTNDGHIAMGGSVLESPDITEIDFDALSLIESACYAKILVGTTGNGQMTYGLTLSQGGADDEIFALRSTDIAHSFNNEVESEIFFDIKKHTAATGGAALRGFTENVIGLNLRGAGTTDVTTKATTSNAYVCIDATNDTSGSFGAIGTNANLVVFRDDTTTRAIIDKEGDLHLDASSNASAFDFYDDVQLLTGLRASLMPDGDILKERFADWMEKARPVLENAGIITYNDDGHHFIALKKLHMLEIDAMRQLYERILKLEERLPYDDTS